MNSEYVVRWYNDNSKDQEHPLKSEEAVTHQAGRWQQRAREDERNSNDWPEEEKGEHMRWRDSDDDWRRTRIEPLRT